MIDLSILYINILVAAGIISFLLGLLIVRQRNVNGSGFLAIIFFVLALWTIAAAIEGSAADQATKILWAKIQYIPMVNIMPLLVLFVLSYTERIRKPYPAWVTMFWMIPLFVLVLVWTNEWHGLIWSGFQPVDPQTKLMIYEHGIAYWIMLIYFYFLVLLMLTLLIVEMVKSTHRKYRWQSLLMIIATLGPAIGGLVYVSGKNPIPGLDWTPVGVLISVVILSASVFGFRYMDIVPVARTFLLEQMESGVLVIDPNIRVVDMNPAFSRFFKDQKIQIGMDAHKILADSGISNVPFEKDGKIYQQEIFGKETEWYCLDFRLSELYRKTRFLGWLGEFREISDQKRADQEKERINKQLNEKLNEVQALQQKLREQAIRDPLTNVYNRRFFDETLNRELALAKRSSRPLSILMIDIDHFKNVNDEFGHEQGDRVLRSFGSLLMNQTRKSDVVCRYGGEEFIILLPNMEIEKAVIRSNKLREEFRMMCLKNPVIKKEFTLSIGLAYYPKHGETAEVLVQKADTAMYEAKNSGRNRCEVAV